MFKNNNTLKWTKIPLFKKFLKKKKNFTPWEVLTFEIFSNTQFWDFKLLLFSSNNGRFLKSFRCQTENNLTRILALCRVLFCPSHDNRSGEESAISSSTTTYTLILENLNKMISNDIININILNKMISNVYSH